MNIKEKFENRDEFASPVSTVYGVFETNELVKCDRKLKAIVAGVGLSSAG